tara:strand:- start:217 stop:486 length:270 start_codon:yes stop_codon:yes gene_type:complete
MGKKKTKKNNYSSKFISILVIVAFTFSAGYVSFRVGKSFLEEDFNINSNQVWCANCQTYHDKETAEKEKQAQKLTWCIDCQKFHEPYDE